MQEIQDFVDTKISQDKTIWITQVLFTLFYSTEEHRSVQEEIQKVAKELAEE